MLLLLLGVFVITSENYIMTLGDYGKPSPAFCDETQPRNGLCNACALQCGEHKYKKNCELCERTLKTSIDI